MKLSLMGKPLKHLDESPDNGMKLLFSKNFIISYVYVVPVVKAILEWEGKQTGSFAPILNMTDYNVIPLLSDFRTGDIQF